MYVCMISLVLYTPLKAPNHPKRKKTKLNN